MSLHRGKVVDRGCECVIATRIEHGQYRSEVKCGHRSRQYEGPTNGAGVQAIALAVVKDFVTRIKAPTLTPAKARRILHDRGPLSSKKPLSAAARGYMGAVARGMRGNPGTRWKGIPEGLVIHWSVPNARWFVTWPKSAPVERRQILFSGSSEQVKSWIAEHYRAKASISRDRRNPTKLNHWLLPLAVGVPAGAVVGAAAMHRGMKGQRKQNAGFVNAYSVAAGKGFPYIRGDGEARGGIWYGRFTKTSEGTGPALFVGYDEKKRRWLTFMGNPLAKSEAAYLMRWSKAHRSKGGQDFRAGLPISAGVEFGQATGLANAVGIYGASAESRARGARGGHRASIGALRAMGSIGKRVVASNFGTVRCNGCGYDVPRSNPRHLDPRTRVECNGLVAVEKYHGRGTPVLVRGAVASGSCRRCLGKRSVRLGSRMVSCPTCCRKNKSATKASKTKSAIRRNNFASHRPDCKCILCSGAIYKKKGVAC